MERYKTRRGVVLTSICGENILVAAKELRKYCPYVSNLNETSAFLWQKLIDGATEDELMDAVCEEYEIDDPDGARQAVKAFLAQMLELNYITVEGEQNEEE